jgi:hypothetical protein
MLRLADEEQATFKGIGAVHAKRSEFREFLYEALS